MAGAAARLKAGTFHTPSAKNLSSGTLRVGPLTPQMTAGGRSHISDCREHSCHYQGDIPVEPVFRKACEGDLPAIVALIADDGLGRGREDPTLPLDPAYAAAFERLDADPNQFQLVAEVGGEVAGILQMTFIPGLSRKGALRCQIEAVRVAASHRGAGLGEKMMQWAIAESRAHGCALVQLTSDNTRKDAHRFYSRLGFIDSHIGYKLKLEP